MSNLSLLKKLQDETQSLSDAIIENKNEITVEVSSENLLQLMNMLRDSAVFHFEQLIDLAGVDYQDYGIADWMTTQSSLSGFSRGVEPGIEISTEAGTETSSNSETNISNIQSQFKSRFAVVYHLLSLKHNHRVRVRTYAVNEPPIVPSVINIWNAADWYEREAFDLYGILFDGHPDLRRILTDYGFIGHPFRKDFPLIGETEVRYDAKEGRVIYEKVSISPRTLVPKTIRDDHRYLVGEG